MKQSISILMQCALVVLVGLTGACGPVSKTVRPSSEEMSEVTKLAVVVPAEGSFTVINERAKATVAPVLMFGLVGAVVASAHNNQLDQEKADLLAKNIKELSCRSKFLESFLNTLKENGRFTDVKLLDQESMTEGATDYDAVATLKIDQWGLRLTERSQGDLMKPFVEVNAKLIRTANQQVLWDEQDVFAGRSGQSLSAYQHEADLLGKDMEEAISEAGRRVAMTLIYQ